MAPSGQVWASGRMPRVALPGCGANLRFVVALTVALKRVNQTGNSALTRSNANLSGFPSTSANTFASVRPCSKPHQNKGQASPYFYEARNVWVAPWTKPDGKVGRPTGRTRALAEASHDRHVQVSEEAVTLGLASEHVAKKVRSQRVPRVKRRTLTPAEMSQVIACCDARYSAVVALYLG